MELCSSFLVCSNSYVLLHHNHVPEGEENSITWNSLGNVEKISS